MCLSHVFIEIFAGIELDTREAQSRWKSPSPRIPQTNWCEIELQGVLSADCTKDRHVCGEGAGILTRAVAVRAQYEGGLGARIPSRGYISGIRTGMWKMTTIYWHSFICTWALSYAKYVW
jgi:hypothetical protein